MPRRCSTAASRGISSVAALGGRLRRRPRRRSGDRRADGRGRGGVVGRCRPGALWRNRQRTARRRQPALERVERRDRSLGRDQRPLRPGAGGRRRHGRRGGRPGDRRSAGGPGCGRDGGAVTLLWGQLGTGLDTPGSEIYTRTPSATSALRSPSRTSARRWRSATSSTRTLAARRISSSARRRRRSSIPRRC